MRDRGGRQVLVPAGLLHLAGGLEAVEIMRQRRRGTGRSLVRSSADLDPTSTRLLALTWWPAGILGLAAAAGLHAGGRWGGRCHACGMVVTGAGITLRQWAIASLGPHFVGHVTVQPGQTVVSSGPYRWLRHPSYTGQWLEMVGVGLSTGNVLSLGICAVLPLVGISARITGEERELAAGLPGYTEFMQRRARLVPHIW